MSRTTSDDLSPDDRGTHWVLWTAVTVFVVLAIGGLWAVDYFYAPEMISEAAVPDAVGK